ncbi:MAG: cytochrome c [Acidobacteria bacterium]|nr:cytochrome c [Acidobacteriota bacterium]MCA1608715.1 cytochrome c [Acidobacteriota bacterium]
MVLLFVIFGLVAACLDRKPKNVVIADSKAYEASLFRQQCAVCHGAEGEGKKLDDGTLVPSLREGQFKVRTEVEIHSQIANGGNGMTPFRGLLTERELRLMTEFVRRDLREGK